MKFKLKIKTVLLHDINGFDGKYVRVAVGSKVRSQQYLLRYIGGGMYHAIDIHGNVINSSMSLEILDHRTSEGTWELADELYPT